MDLVNIPFIKLIPDDDARPWLPIVIENPHAGRETKTYALIDTGADECALPAQYAPLIGHNLQEGHQKEVNTGNGVTIAYSHTISIRIDAFKINNILVDFMPNLAVPLLGVKSFLSNFLLTIDYPKQVFSLKSKI